MLGSFIYGSKGMVSVPDLFNKTVEELNVIINTYGLKSISSGTVITSDSLMNNKVASQNPAAGTLVDYESEISYSLYVYSGSTPTPTPTSLYYAAACCNGSPIYATGNTDAEAINSLYSQCSGGTITGQTSSQSGYPTPICTGPTPTPTPFTVWYGSSCCNGTVLQAYSTVSASRVVDIMSENCPGGIITNESIIQGTSDNPSYPSISCTTTPTPSTPTECGYPCQSCEDNNCTWDYVNGVCNCPPTPTPTPTPIPTECEINCYCNFGVYRCFDCNGDSWNAGSC